jgi:transcription elongation factor Elf1
MTEGGLQPQEEYNGYNCPRCNQEFSESTSEHPGGMVECTANIQADGITAWWPHFCHNCNLEFHELYSLSGYAVQETN